MSTETDEELRSFTDTSGDEFLFKKLSVTPFAGDPTHFIFVCASLVELEGQVQGFREELESTQEFILYMLSIVISTVIFITLLLLWITTRKETKKMIDFTKLTRNLILHADQSSAKSINATNQLNECDLHDALKDRIHVMKQYENEFSYYDWKGVRPPDITLFNSWRTQLHPKNRLKDKNINWDRVFKALKALEALNY